MRKNKESLLMLIEHNKEISLPLKVRAFDGSIVHQQDFTPAEMMKRFSVVGNIHEIN